MLNHITEAVSAFGTRGRTLIAVGVALLSWWLSFTYGPHDDEKKKAKPGRVDYFSKGLKRTVMGEDGNPKEFLIADEMVHYEEENTAILARPIMTLYTKAGPPWVIHSESAKIPGNSEFIFLDGEVLVDYAETDEYIRVISPPDFMTGTGATINFGSELTYRILHDVRRRHDVEPKSTEQ